MKRRTSYRAAFTLIELMVVIIVIAILASVVTVAYKNVRDNAKQAVTLRAFGDYEQMLRSYKGANGSYPATQRVGNNNASVIENNGNGAAGFVCLGSNYPADPPFAAGECVHSSTASLTTTVYGPVNDALQTINNDLPNPIGKTVSSGATSMRGIAYTSQRRPDGTSQNTQLIFAPVDGKTCGRGTLIASSPIGAPLCDLLLK